MNDKMPPTPSNLQRSPVPIKRTKVELPTRLSDGTILADLTIPELLEKRSEWEAWIGLHEQRQIELRAIRASIRKKA